MDAGQQHQHPQRRTEQQIGRQAHDAEAVEGGQSRDQHACAAEGVEVEFGGIKHRDDQHRAEVVDDGQGSEKNFERGGHAWAQQR
ncbi:hypothetical protein D3C87_1082320 [compost metagenome]